MSTRTGFTAEEARRTGEEIGIDWASAAFDVEQFRMGMDDTRLERMEAEAKREQ
jgi:hypothetical protein